MADCIINKCFHQVCDKSSATVIKTIKWSPASDLAAVISKEGEVRVHRLYWQKVWSIFEKETTATSLAWHPEGKTLAIGYDSGLIKVVEIEKGNVITTFNVEAAVVSLDWMFLMNTSQTKLTSPSDASVSETTRFVHKLVTLTGDEQRPSASPNVDKLLEVPEESAKPNLMFVGTQDGSVTLLLNGIFTLAVVKIPDVMPDINFTVKSTSLSAEQSVISIVTSVKAAESDTNFSLCLFGSGLLSSRAHEIATLGTLFIFVNSLIDLCSKVINQMSDSWEDILLRISSKLSKLDEMLPPESSVADGFLIAFVCGTASPELQSFLLHDLTLKGLKTLGNNVTTCYKDIEELALHKLEVYCQSLMHCLTELRGMSRWYDKFGLLGLSEDLVHSCITNLGSLILKVREVIQVINSDLKNFRAFFRWVTGLVLRLSDESTQKNLKEFSQEHYARILYFLQTHLKRSEEDPHFQLERVGQYLKEDTLKLKMDYSKNPWFNFVAQSAELKDSPLLMHPADDRSLTASFSSFKQTLTHLYKSTTESISKSFEFGGKISLFSAHGSHKEECHASVYQYPHGANDIQLYFLPCSCSRPVFYRYMVSGACQNIHLQQLTISGSALPLTRIGVFSYLLLKDISYFDDKSLILLLQGSDKEGRNIDMLLQASHTSTLKGEMVQYQENMDVQMIPSTDISCDIYKLRVIDITDATFLSVSGARRVASIVSKNCRRVQIFDIAGDEEEEEAETSQMAEEESFS